MHNIRASGRDVQLSPLQFVLQQILLLHPLTAPIWLSGVIFLLLSQRLKDFRLFGWSYLIALTAFIVLKGKNYYLAPIYPMLFAAGAVVVESGIEWTRQVWLKPAMIVVLLAGGAWFAPLVVPVFSVAHFISYLNYLPFKPPRSSTVMSAPFCRNIMRISLAGKRWSRSQPRPGPGCPLNRKLTAVSLPRTMVRPERSISLARAMGCRPRSADIKPIIFGGPEVTQASA